MKITVEENGVKRNIAPLKVTYDKEVDAAYIYLADIGPGGVKHSEPTQGGPILDYNHENQLIGIEILNASKTLPQDVINSAIESVTEN